ncbi:MAG: TrkH family potassium uptake protein [Rhodospirillales bacterium]|nr:TrkH family potassium uptake protein [Rhodospirillales bacterium]MSP79697.1 TrkH family potassium uptake protein [Rhodospirillales bacterium]
MLLPAAADWAVGHPEWRAFAVSSGVTAFAGGALLFANRSTAFTLDRKRGFLLTSLSWVLLCAFAALPFTLSEYRLPWADAYFEAMSGLTTTGATVLTRLDSATPGVLLWRGLLQFLGGIGIVVMAIALLPFLSVGGMQLFKTESSDISEKSMPQIKQVATGIFIAYVALNLACALAYWAAGMTGFEAAIHAMSTVSTGGFSTSDDSIGHFKSPTIEWIGAPFMFLGGLPFILYLRTAMGHSGALFRDPQARMLALLVMLASLAVAAWLVETRAMPVADALRLAVFHVVSIVTTTGFVAADYMEWGAFPIAAFFFLTFVGGCTGSTAGGIKIFRFEVLAIAIRAHGWRLIAPLSVRPTFYGERKLSNELFASVLLFMGAYVGTVAVTALLLAAFGLDLVTALSGAATAVGNVGPGLGNIIGPAGTFAPLPPEAKWVLSLAMLLGRLELFTVLVLFSRAFWRT